VNTLEREAVIQDLWEGRIGRKQLALGVFFMDQGYEADEAVRILETIRDFNRAQREAAETGQPKVKVAKVEVATLIAELNELIGEDLPVVGTEADYADGVSDSIVVAKRLGGVQEEASV
jgi:hypothetical protein